MELITPAEMKALRNPGVESIQLVSPENSQSVRVTLTRVTVQPGHEQPRHVHPASEPVTSPPIDFGYAYAKAE
jgi:quercetin dioxygenase-like cupin family protein